MWSFRCENQTWANVPDHSKGHAVPSSPPVDPPTCDYLLSFVTSSEEAALKAAVLAHNIPWKKNLSAHGEFYDLGTLGTSRVVAVKTAMGAFGPSGAISSAHYYLDKTRATGMISVGMAFGLSRQNQQHGTVLISEALFPYDDRVVLPDSEGRFEYAYRDKQAVPCKPDLLRIFRNHEVERRPDEEGYKAEFGVLLSGSAKVECTAYRDLLFRWCRQFGNLVGGEMEGVALLSLRKDWAGIVVKGICDFAEDGQREEVRAHRKVACTNAARFAIDALHRWNPNSTEV